MLLLRLLLPFFWSLRLLFFFPAVIFAAFLVLNGIAFDLVIALLILVNLLILLILHVLFSFPKCSYNHCSSQVVLILNLYYFLVISSHFLAAIIISIIVLHPFLWVWNRLQDFLKAYIRFKRNECRLVDFTPHPKEYELYYHC